MKSFELSLDDLQLLEERLRGRIDELERLRDEFPAVSERLRGATEGLRSSPLGRLFSSFDEEPDETVSPMSPAEALAFAKRHSAENSRNAGYLLMVRRIRDGYGELLLSNDLLRQMHRHVVGHDARESGMWKTSNNFFPILNEYGDPISSILTVDWEHTPQYMESLEGRFLSAWDSKPVSRVLLIALYWLDLLGIHPFHDGNGRVSRLAVMLLLCQSEHAIAQHTSLEGFVSRRRTAYVTALRASLNGWIESRHDPYLWCEFVIDSIRDAYFEVSGRAEALISVTEQSNAITAAIAKMPQAFLIADLKAVLPDIPEGIMRMVLGLAREDGTLLASVTEGAVRWERTSPGQIE